MRSGFHPREQGDAGEASAVEWLASAAARVFVPLGHSPDCDLVADLGGRLVRVQVKTSSFHRAGRWEVVLATRGGIDPDYVDLLFVHVGDGRRWLIPAARIGGGTAILLGGPKYASFEVDPGRPFGRPGPGAGYTLSALGRGSRAVKGARL